MTYKTLLTVLLPCLSLATRHIIFIFTIPTCPSCNMVSISDCNFRGTITRTAAFFNGKFFTTAEIRFHQIWKRHRPSTFKVSNHFAECWICLSIELLTLVTHLIHLTNTHHHATVNGKVQFLIQSNWVFLTFSIYM